MSVQYKRNYIKNVIVRIDFANNLPNLEKGVPAGLAKVILKHFPISEPQKITEGTLKLNPTEIQSAPVRQMTIWNYFGKEREKTLAIGEKHLFIDSKVYKNFAGFKDEFLVILNSFIKEFPDIHISRFGLRYVNKIELEEANPIDWNSYISENLLTIFKNQLEGEEVTRAFHIFSSRKDDINFTFQYGMHNPDYPASIKKKIFILDLDAYLQGEQTEADITTNIGKFHEIIETHFEESITDDLRSKMNE